MPDTSSEREVTIKPGGFIKGTSGQKLTITITPPRCIADAHAHVENGACVPLPLLWDKSWLIRWETREQIDEDSTKGYKGFIFSLMKGEAGAIQVMPTFKIGNKAVNENKNAFAFDTLIGKSNLYAPPKNEAAITDFHSFLIILMMDMEYAHIAGLYGQTIYHEDTPYWYYYRRSSL